MSDQSGGPAAFQGSHSPFVGRERELTLLGRQLQDAIRGTPSLALIAGEPGIGKTRLAVELAASAKTQGFQTQWGRCYEWEGAPAYWPWIQILRAVIAGIEPDDLPALLGTHAADIAQILPELHDLLPELEPLPEIGPDHARFRLFAGVTAFIAAVSGRQPLMLVLEDLHWADTASLLLAQFLAQGVRDAPLLVVGTYRDVDVGSHHPLAAAIADLSREPMTERIDLTGLPREQVGCYIELAGPPSLSDELATSIYDRTEGNPLFMVELVRLLASQPEGGSASPADRRSAGIPANVRHVIAHRVEQLPGASQRVLSVASVIGREFELVVLQAVAGLSVDEVMDALDAALGARLVDEWSVGRYRFSHTLVQETLYQDLSATQRARLHADVGEKIERMSGETGSARLDDLAFHFFRAAPLGGVERAVTYAVRAAEQASARLAWEDAAALYTRALDLLGQRGEAVADRRIDLLLALGDLCVLAGNAGAAKDAYRRAISLADALGDAVRFARAALGLSGDLQGVVPFHPADDEAIELLREALERLPHEDSPIHVRVMTQLAVSWLKGDYSLEERNSYAVEARAMAQRLDDPVSVLLALITSWGSLWFDPRWFAERRSLHRELRRFGMGLNNLFQRACIHVCIAQDLLVAGEVCEADLSLQRTEQIAEQTRMPMMRYPALCTRAALTLQSGAFQTAEEHAIEAAVIGRDSHREQGRVQNELISVQFLLRYLQGRLDELDGPVRRYADQYRGDAYWESRLALIDAVLGRHADARTRVDALMSGSAGDIAVGHAWNCTVAMVAESCALLGDARHVDRLYAHVLPFAEQNFSEQTITYGPGSHYLGLLATLMGEWEDAERHFGAASTMNERMGARPFLARTQAAWADMLLRRGDPVDGERARSLAQEAHATAGELGMAGLAEQALTLLETTPPISGHEASRTHGLSSREMEVLRLVVEGKTDREIAESLYISHRTVMRHVTNILNKLGVSSRTAAATAAMRDGIV